MTRVGIDVGGVIIDGIKNDNIDTAFRGKNFMKTTAVQGAFHAIKTLVHVLGPDNVYIISKCGEQIQRKTRLWLDGQYFYGITKFNPDNVRFCLTRPEKAPIAQELGLTHHVDDKLDVLRHMEASVPHRLLFGPQPAGQQPNGVYLVRGWMDVLTVIGNTRSRAS